MRYLFECLECGTHYLPPESMRYPDGPASPVWCADCQSAMRERGVPEPEIPARIALAAAKAALAAYTAPAGAPAPSDVRPSRPARTRRAAAGPGSTRSRLG
ncbi:hypothetical protein [Kitasatospora sp. NPDC057223]|uniref:hypothetical protein n=1 Tax=Kitasatospora sp. NPDC057223 TaxID=3346055 RepID=UPI003629EAB1